MIEKVIIAQNRKKYKKKVRIVQNSKKYEKVRILQNRKEYGRKGQNSIEQKGMKYKYLRVKQNRQGCNTLEWDRTQKNRIRKKNVVEVIRIKRNKR